MNCTNLNDLWASLLFEELARQGLSDVFLAPGSRQAPLAMAVANHPKLQSHVHYDERALAFWALGAAKVQRKPVAIVTTSGSAVANLLPAIVEAAQSCVPLIVITADRPVELHRCQANQSIDQQNIFGGFVRLFEHLPCPEEQCPVSLPLNIAASAYARSEGPLPGPVHLNCAFREPLHGQVQDRPWQELLNPLEPYLQSDQPWTQYVAQTQESSFSDLPDFSQSRVLMVCGLLENPQDRKALYDLSEKMSWPLLADVSSGLRFSKHRPASVICNYKELLSQDPTLPEALKADVVIYLGGPLISKELLSFVSSYGPNALVRVYPWPLRTDPLQAGALRLEVSAQAFACSVLKQQTLSSAQQEDLCQAWQDQQKLSAEKPHADPLGFSEQGIVHSALELAPKDCQVFVSNSLPIRHMEALGQSASQNIQLFVNRGASGIDGNLATVAGIAQEGSQPTVAILGDLAVLHDLGSLKLFEQSKCPLVLVVLNNDGGQIFQKLPISMVDPKVLEKFFIASHGLHFEPLCQMFGLDYRPASSLQAFEEHYQQGLLEHRACLIEVCFGK